MKENLKYIDKVLSQLQITPKDPQQRHQLQQLLLRKLSYPSTQLAYLHMQANRLGKLDCKNLSPETRAEMESRAQKCKCCGFVRQEETVPLCTSVNDVRHVGVSTRLLYMALFHSIIALLVMFLIYCLYAIISNVKSCNYNAANLNPQYQNSGYARIVAEWVFSVSLLSNISCMTSSTAYQIQCWLGLVMIVVLAFVIAALKLRKIWIGRGLLREIKSVQIFSVLIENMPVHMSKDELQKQLREYQKKMNLKTKQSQKEISIVKINKAAPFYLSSELFNDPQAKKISEQYQKIRQQLINLVTYRMKKQKFPIERTERNELYQQYQRVKKKRIQTYKRSVLNNVLTKKQNSSHRVVTAPTFVTFQNTYNKKFILDLHTTLKKYLGQSKCFHFQVPGSTKTIPVDIKDAPKPEQIIWTNLGQSRSELIKKKILIGFITLIILAGTGTGLYFLQQANFQFKLNNLNTSTLWFSLLVSVILLITSYVVFFVITILVTKQRNFTYINQQNSLSIKIILGQIGHYILVPLIFNLFFVTRFIGILSLSQTVFFLSLQRSFVAPVLKILDPIYLGFIIIRLIAKKPKNKIGKTQSYLNKKFQLMNFGVGFQFGYLICSMLFTAFFAPLQPIIVVFAIAGIFVNYLFSSYSLRKRCTRPVLGGRLISTQVNKFMGFTPIAFAIGSLIWPYYVKKQFVGLVPCILQIVVSVGLYFVPLERLIDKAVARYEKDHANGELKQEYLYSETKDNHVYDYQQLNYVTASLKKSPQMLDSHSETHTQTSKSNTNYLNIYKQLMGTQNLSTFLNTDSKSFKNVEATPSVKSTFSINQQKQQENYREQESVVYASQVNDKAILIDAILNHLRDNMEIIAADQNAGVNTASHLIKNKSMESRLQENYQVQR